MLERSVFNPETIKIVVKQTYNIDVTSVRKINVGSANLYSLNNDEYVLKEFQSKITNEDVIKEINVINHLRKDGLSVPEYIKTVNNEYSFTYKEKIVIMQRFIKGDTKELNTGSKEQIKECALNYGKIVLSLNNIDFDLPLRDTKKWFDIEDSINKKEKLLSKCNNKKVIDDLKDKINMLNNIKETINIKEMLDNITIKNTHGDYNILQFIYENEKIKSIIDFATACKMPIIWEIIRSYSYIDPECKDGGLNIDNLIDYVKEVNKYVRLNKYDLKYMSYYYLIQLLCSDYGYKQYIEDNSKVELLNFGIYRTKLAKNLMKYSDIISKRLLSEIEC